MKYISVPDLIRSLFFGPIPVLNYCTFGLPVLSKLCKFGLPVLSNPCKPHSLYDCFSCAIFLIGLF